MSLQYLEICVSRHTLTFILTSLMQKFIHLIHAGKIHPEQNLSKKNVELLSENEW